MQDANGLFHPDPVIILDGHKSIKTGLKWTKQDGSPLHYTGGLGYTEGDIDYAFQHAYEKHPYFCLQPVITMNNGRVSYESELKSPETYRNARKSCQNGKIRTKLSQEDILVLRTEYPFYIVGVYHGSFHIWTGSIRYLHFCFRTHVIPL